MIVMKISIFQEEKGSIILLFRKRHIILTLLFLFEAYVTFFERIATERWI